MIWCPTQIQRICRNIKNAGLGGYLGPEIDRGLAIANISMKPYLVSHGCLVFKLKYNFKISNKRGLAISKHLKLKISFWLIDNPFVKL